jgi:hypothetical protein
MWLDRIETFGARLTGAAPMVILVELGIAIAAIGPD